MKLYVGVLKEGGIPELFELGEWGLYHRHEPVSTKGYDLTGDISYRVLYRSFPDEFIRTPIPLEQYLISHL